MSDLIDGVRCRPLDAFTDSRGVLMRMVRADDPGFAGFGEIYFSGVDQGAIKAWRRHNRSTSQFAVPIGAIQLVMFDDRPGSATCGAVMVIETGRHHYQLITIPPGVWNGFRGRGPGLSLVANCASLAHDPAESDRLEPTSAKIPFEWSAP
ncbi:MAG TPA: hypothetical protein VNJ02_07410 [Vicinamibacterales bacterium]|nr:hypothetical protein [Vicinamibacterales bacterium]